VLTVQAVIESTIEKVLKTHVNCIGCGRTDAMVHAAQYIFHFDYYEKLPDKFLFRLNKSLPDDIAVFDIIPVEGYPHAQFDAIERTYDYFVHTRKDPFLHGFSALYEYPKLSYNSMSEAAKYLVKFTDYSLFCKTPARNDSNICLVTSSKLFVNQKAGRFRFQISANRFVKGMIRIIVRRLMDIGIGELSVEDFKNILEANLKPSEITIAHPQGLYLTKVKYPFLELPTQGEFYGNLFNISDCWEEL
jgi:tRNA pseudouridine38-40 synthase